MWKIPVVACLLAWVVGCGAEPSDRAPTAERRAAEAREAGGIGPDPVAREAPRLDPAAAQAELYRLLAKWPVRFREGSAGIEEGAGPLIERVAALLRVNEALRIRVCATAKSERSPARNLHLSRRRAAAVVKAIAEHGVPAARMEPLGFGQVRPVPPQAPPEVRETNPGLWIVVVRPD